MRLMRALRLWTGAAAALVGFVSIVGATAPASANGGGSPINLALNDPGRVGHLRVTLNKSHTIRFGRSFGEALVAAPDIADVVPLTDNSIYLVGKRIGLTRLTMLDRDKRMLGIIEVEVSFDVKGLREELERNVPGANFRLSTANGRIILGGMVPDAMSLSRAVSITEQFTAGCDEQSEPTSARPPAAGPPGAGAGAGAAAATLQLQITGPGMAKGGNGGGQGAKCFVNSLTVRAPQQVMLEVRFVEAQRTAARDLGLSWDSGANRFRGFTGGVTSSPTITRTIDPNTKNDFGLPKAVTHGVLDAGALITGFPSSAVPFGTFVTQILSNGFSADVVIQALEKRGIARRLAEPNLVALSGDTANFLAGGEFPFPVGADRDRITIEFKKFGIGLAFTPTVLSGGQINLKIEPEVSDLDPNNFILINNVRIPSLVVRRAHTTVELRDGQSFAIAGLLQTQHSKDTRELPWIAEVPVIGTLFRSASYDKRESDLVIIVTPRLVQPAVPGQKLATPFDQVVPGNDRDFFLRGKLEVPKHFDAPYGHILELGRPTAAKIDNAGGGHVIK